MPFMSDTFCINSVVKGIYLLFIVFQDGSLSCIFVLFFPPFILAHTPQKERVRANYIPSV